MMAVYLLILLGVLQVGDAVTTMRALAMPGKYEANPVMRWLFDQLGIAGGLIVEKSLAMTLCGALVWSFGNTISCALAIVCVIYIGVVVNNLRLILR